MDTFKGTQSGYKHQWTGDLGLGVNEATCGYMAGSTFVLQVSGMTYRYATWYTKNGTCYGDPIIVTFPEKPEVRTM